MVGARAGVHAPLVAIHVLQQPNHEALHAPLPSVSLALSLHAPTQELRQTIVPSAKAFKLDK